LTTSALHSLTFSLRRFGSGVVDCSPEDVVEFEGEEERVEEENLGALLKLPNAPSWAVVWNVRMIMRAATSMKNAKKTFI